jgi:hypothetical protein
LGIDYEFYESSLVPSIVVYGFLGLEADPAGMLRIRPQLPAGCPRAAVSNILYRGVRMDLAVSRERIEITLKDVPLDPLRVALEKTWSGQGFERVNGVFLLPGAGTYHFDRRQ